MFARRTEIAQRVLGGVDLAIDLATLGEYGLEPLHADGPCRERPERADAEAFAWTGWEALATARRGACDERPGQTARARRDPRRGAGRAQAPPRPPSRVRGNAALR